MTTTADFSTVSVNGLELAYRVQGEGEPLLLLHGFFGSSADWAHLFDLDQLARTYRLIMPDARGHGRSTNPSGAFTFRLCAADVQALLDHLGLARVKAVGLSLGGGTLLHVATQARDRIDAMVLIAAPSYFPTQARALTASVSERDEDHPEAEWRELRARHVQGDDQIRALWRIAREFATSYDDVAFTPPLLATIRARTLIVTGDRDGLYPLEMFVEQYRAIPGAALMVIPDGGHHAVFGAARPDFVRAALAFLRG
ncbi:MAG TPA: alpha/beta fold hydrolase [Polyangia bacterium]|nr:alpha/beta fold hydrolase [Polyangia bacterium]